VICDCRNLRIESEKGLAKNAEKIFVCISQYLVPLDEVDKYLDDHIEWLTRLDQAGRSVVTGRREPPVGGVMIISGDSIVEVRELLSSDPFQKNGCTAYHVHEVALNPDPMKGRLMEYFTGSDFNANNKDL